MRMSLLVCIVRNLRGIGRSISCAAGLDLTPLAIFVSPWWIQQEDPVQGRATDVAPVIMLGGLPYTRGYNYSLGAAVLQVRCTSLAAYSIGTARLQR